MAGLGNGQNAFCKINIVPLQGNEFPDTQSAVQAEKNAVQLIFLAILNGLLYLFLLGEGKTLHGLLFQFRAFEFIRRVFFRQPQQVRRFQRPLNDGDNSVYAVRRQTFTRLSIAALQKLRYELL